MHSGRWSTGSRLTSSHHSTCTRAQRRGAGYTHKCSGFTSLSTMWRSSSVWTRPSCCISIRMWTSKTLRWARTLRTTKTLRRPCQKTSTTWSLSSFIWRLTSVFMTTSDAQIRSTISTSYFQEIWMYLITCNWITMIFSYPVILYLVSFLSELSHHIGLIQFMESENS